MTENEAIDLVLSIALEQVGYHEKATAADLDSKTANPGSGNFTRFSRDMDAISGFYNGKKQGVAWCDLFVDWCVVQAFGAEDGRLMLCQPKRSSGAGCTSSAKYYQAAGRFFLDGQRGDQIFFHASDGNGFGHTGIVEKVTDKKIYTIEGNADDQVKKRSYALADAKIGGYGRPKWEIAAKEGLPVYQATVWAETGKTVYLRKSPSTKASVIEAVPIGTVVDVLEEINAEWARISDSGVEGCMMRKFLQPVEDAPGDGQDVPGGAEIITRQELKEVQVCLINALRIINKALGE